MTTIPPISNGIRWYYADANNQPQGPYSCEELTQFLAGKKISTVTLVIKEGDAEWKPYRELFSDPVQATLPPVPSPLAPVPQSQATFSTSQAPVMEAVGIRGSIELFPDKIRIKRKGLLASLAGIKGDKDIFLSQITAVQFKAAGFTSRCFQISYPGASSAHENAIIFDKKKQPAFEKIKMAIESFQAGKGITIPQPGKVAASSPSTQNKKEPQRLWLGALAFVVFCVFVGLSNSESSNNASSGMSSGTATVSESTPEPTPPPQIVDMPIEKKLAIVNANKASLPSDDVTIARFRYLLDRAVARTGDTPKEIADAACKGQGVVRENGKDITLLVFMESVNKLLSAPGVPEMKYFDAATMTAIELSK